MGITALVACSGSRTSATPSPVPPNRFTSSFPPLNVSTIHKLTEIQNFVSSEHGGRILGVNYTLDADQVLAVYEDGYLVGWDIETSEVVLEHSLGIVSSKALSFSASGTLLMGATEHMFKPDISNKMIEYVNGLALWQVENGKLFRCITYPCDGGVNRKDGYLGASIDQKGRWNIVFSEPGISTLDLSGKDPGRISAVNSWDADYQWNVGAIAIDSIHERYALVFQEGRIGLDSFNPSTLVYRTIAEGNQNNLHEIVAAEFDPTGQWLAVIRDDHLSVWQVDKITGALYFERGIPNAVTLQFGQFGKLLIVADDEKILIWDMEGKKVAADFQTPSITSLAISEDNKLLLWGDAQGKVHLWAISHP